MLKFLSCFHWSNSFCLCMCFIWLLCIIKSEKPVLPPRTLRILFHFCQQFCGFAKIICLYHSLHFLLSGIFSNFNTVLQFIKVANHFNQEFFLKPSWRHWRRRVYTGVVIYPLSVFLWLVFMLLVNWLLEFLPWA